MGTLTKSFFGAIKPKEGQGNFLPVGDHISVVKSVSSAVPMHNDEEFTDVASQLKTVVAVEGLGAGAIYNNDRGYVKTEDIDEETFDAIVQNQPIDFQALGITKSNFAKLKHFEDKREALFSTSRSGHAYRLDTMERVTDLVTDKRGNPLPEDQQGEKTQQAWAITGRLLHAMGLEEGQDPETGVGSHIRIRVKQEQNINDNTITRITVLGPATEEQYQEYLEAIAE